jgi:hypothetical protein
MRCGFSTEDLEVMEDLQVVEADPARLEGSDGDAEARVTERFWGGEFGGTRQAVAWYALSRPYVLA